MTENDAVLEVNQAFFGLLSDDINAVALDYSGTAFTIYVALARDTPQVREDLDDMAGDLEASLLPADPDIRVVAGVSTTGPEWAGRQHRLVLLRKQGT